MEEARRRLSSQKTDNAELLGEGEGDEDGEGGLSPLLRLAEIEEDDEDE